MRNKSCTQRGQYIYIENMRQWSMHVAMRQGDRVEHEVSLKASAGESA